MSERILIVGASSGIGAALAVEMARTGRTIGLVARRQDALDAIAAAVTAKGALAVVQACDATKDADVQAAWRSLWEAMGGIDTIVYSSGVMPGVAADEFDIAKDRAIIETNVIGAMAWLDCAATDFLRQGHGTLCGIGSVAGDRGRRLAPAYGASKAALHTFLESLRNRLSVHGILVVTVKPGPTDTPMARPGAAKPGGLYPVDLAARRIALALDRGEHTVYVPARWRVIMTVVQCIPSFLFKKLSI
jgi:decaprenylphospho-beta-D-erythro-pentofuranosid-2-ulose 2-reductase